MWSSITRYDKPANPAWLLTLTIATMVSYYCSQHHGRPHESGLARCAAGVAISTNCRVSSASVDHNRKTIMYTFSIVYKGCCLSRVTPWVDYCGLSCSFADEVCFGRPYHKLTPMEAAIPAYKRSWPTEGSPLKASAGQRSNSMPPSCCVNLHLLACKAARQAVVASAIPRGLALCLVRSSHGSGPEASRHPI